MSALRMDQEAYRFFSLTCLGVEKDPAGLAGSELAGPVLEEAISSFVASLDEGAVAERASEIMAGEQLVADYVAMGALWLEVFHEQSHLAILLPPGRVAQLLPAPAQLSPLSPLSLGQLSLPDRVELEVYAAPTMFTIEELESIRPGDVIRLDQKAGASFELRLSNGESFGKAGYGVWNGKAAVRVAR